MNVNIIHMEIGNVTTNLIPNENMFFSHIFLSFNFRLDANAVRWVIMVMQCSEQNMIVNDVVALCQSKAITFRPVAS